MKRVLIFFIVILTTMADTGSVEFISTKIKVTCPGTGFLSWSENLTPRVEDQNSRTVLTDYKDDENTFYCENENGKYYFYVKGKVCHNCFELDGLLVIGVIIGDLLVTGGICMLIYFWAQRKSRPSPTPPAARSGNRAPTVPNRDYETLSSATRDTSTYAVAGVNRTG